jgi:hypothetical protein
VCLSFSRQLYIWSLSEWGYSQLSPGIVIEELQHSPSLRPSPENKVVVATVPNEYLGKTIPVPEPSPSTLPIFTSADDLKCYSMHGHTEYIMHVSSRFGDKHDTVYSRDGTILPVTVRGSQSIATTNPSQSIFRLHPALLSELLQRCDKMAKGLDLVRVDFLLVSIDRARTSNGMVAKTNEAEATSKKNRAAQSQGESGGSLATPTTTIHICTRTHFSLFLPPFFSLLFLQVTPSPPNNVKLYFPIRNATHSPMGPSSWRDDTIPWWRQHGLGSFGV